MSNWLSAHGLSMYSVQRRELLANARVASRQGHHIHVSEHGDATIIVIAVEDEGEGVPAAERELIWRAFARSQAARRSQAVGSGIGLAIVRRSGSGGRRPQLRHGPPAARRWRCRAGRGQICRGTSRRIARSYPNPGGIPGIHWHRDFLPAPEPDPLLATLWSVIVLAGIAAWTVTDTRQYRSFRLEPERRARRAFYWRWTVQSFVVLVGASSCTLWLLGRFDAILELPREFAQLTAWAPENERSADFVSDARMGMVVGAVLGVLMLTVALKLRAAKAVPQMIGDREPMIPRNGAERLAALPLCLNAGFSEELFFRLVLPLLLTTVTGSATVGIGVSIVVFGLIHWYQGWKGVIATAMLGALLTMVYVQSGSILLAMAIHAFIDVMGLVIRPMLAERATR